MSPSPCLLRAVLSAGLDEVFADEIRFHVNVDCVIVVVVKDCFFFMSFILCENCEFVKWMCWMLAFLSEL